MNRQIATKFLRDLLDANQLNHWHIRLTTDVTKPFLGLCSYKDRIIILNAFHIDTHGDDEVINTIKHEVAHALTPNHGHDSAWRETAIKLGCDNTAECANYSLSPESIDAIRSGATLEITYETKVIPEQILRKPVAKISKLQDKCEVCNKVAKVKTRIQIRNKVIITLECGHVSFRDCVATSAFDSIIFDGDPKCKHVWGIGKARTTCGECGAHKLYDYQIIGAQALEKANGRMAIFDEMGLGKTLQSLAYLKFHPEAFPFLWVTKSGVKFQHGKEILRILGIKALPQVLQSGRDTLMSGMNVIASYDIFRRLDLTMFANHGFKSIILDECQAIKNPDSSRTQCIRTIAKNIPRIIPLSGTPWKNRGSEFFVVLNMLDPKRFWSYKSFCDQWVDHYWDGNKYKEGGIRRPDKFKEYIADLAIRRERTEVMPELPLINRTRLISQVDESARKLYNQEKQHLIDIYNSAVIGGDEDSFETAQKLNQSLMIMRQIVGIAKVPATIEFATEFLEETDRKLAIFVHHKKCGELISTQLTQFCESEKLAFRPLVLTADLTPIERMAIAEKFNSNGNRLLIASTLASGEGLNLQSCSDMIMHERQFNPQNEEQAEGRFIRIGQESESVNATYVHGDDTVDTILDNLVERKRLFFHNSMNKGAIATWNEKSLVKELVEAIVKS